MDIITRTLAAGLAGLLLIWGFMGWAVAHMAGIAHPLADAVADAAAHANSPVVFVAWMATGALGLAVGIFAVRP